MKQQVVSYFVLVLVMMLTTTTYGSILSPFLDQRPPTGGLLSSLLAADDPFRILEQIPFGVDRDNVEDQVAISPARVDWKETPDAHFIMLDIPGIKKEEVKIEVEEKRVLRVSGERKKESEEKKGDHWHRVERSYGKFWRQFRLPENVDMDSIQAKLENGVLTLKLNKLSPDKIKGPRLVSIDQTQSQDNQLNSGNVQVDPKNEL